MQPSHPTADAAPSAVPQRRVDQLLAHYGQSHQHPTNERIHVVAIPLIMLTLVGMMYALSPWLAYAFLGASLVYYLRLGSPMLTTCMVAVTAAMLLAIRALDGAGVLLPTSVAVFVVAWVFQFIGHKVEGKKPSFFEDIQYLWVGPLFVLVLFLRRAGLRW